MAIVLFGPEYLQYSSGGPVAEEPIFIYLPGTKTKAVLYSDKNGQYTAPNPMWTDRRGELVFYVEEGEYDLFYRFPAPSGTTVRFTVEGDGGATPGRLLSYTHHQDQPARAFQIPHGLLFTPAGFICIDNNGDVVEYESIVPQVAPGISELTFGFDFAGLVYVS